MTRRWPTSPEYYNSAILINNDGETVANYRKKFLYYTDETWALEGRNDFFAKKLPGLGRTAMGICMDIKSVSQLRAPFQFSADLISQDFPDLPSPPPGATHHRSASPVRANTRQAPTSSKQHGTHSSLPTTS